ncbi:ras family small GTPase [Reticulomyxa filosa]|uniref:Ras family small GTPase n=1 Tax=Reticulomyxa filosa TaxID=46433 RepID=X6LZ90_RETFI|nr:ras family small GTPase [Reticulomyxa filosa]|eukprot:ETO06055.1 ras family small GTPase [Reticulomyxa filosa]
MRRQEVVEESGNRKCLQTFFFIIGTKYYLFDGLPDTYKQQLTTQARKFAQKMHTPLMYCSSIKSINFATIFQFIVINVLNMVTKVEEFHNELTEHILRKKEKKKKLKKNKFFFTKLKLKISF